MNAGQSRCVMRSVITARVGSSPVHAQQDTYTRSSRCLVPDSACYLLTRYGGEACGCYRWSRGADLHVSEAPQQLVQRTSRILCKESQAEALSELPSVDMYAGRRKRSNYAARQFEMLRGTIGLCRCMLRSDAAIRSALSAIVCPSCSHAHIK
jgi:hypothetical protein